MLATSDETREENALEGSTVEMNIPGVMVCAATGDIDTFSLILSAAED